MLFERTMTPCDCGHGPGWYHYSPDGKHEYNPDVSEAQACARMQDARNPIACFFGHIDGPWVHAEVTGGERRKFTEKKHGGTKGALAAAAEWIVEELGRPVQMEMF